MWGETWPSYVRVCYGTLGEKNGWFWWFASTWSFSIATLNKQRVIHLDPSQTYNLRLVVDLERLSQVKALIGLIGIGKAWVSRHVDRCWPFVGVNCKQFCRTEFDDEMSHRKHRNMHLKSMLANTSRPIIDDHLIFFQLWVHEDWLIARASKSHFIPRSEVEMQTFRGHLNVPSENCGSCHCLRPKPCAKSVASTMFPHPKMECLLQHSTTTNEHWRLFTYHHRCNTSQSW